VRCDAPPAGRVQDLMERSGAKLNIVVLDACRDNPFHSGNRASGGGLAAMTGERAPSSPLRLRLERRRATIQAGRTVSLRSISSKRFRNPVWD
jgi:hypothetical protein